jgi:hypothetical protein
MPQGFENVAEAQLHRDLDLLPDDTYGRALKSWWLAESSLTAVTPNWDIASSCTIDGRKGLLLVEAKAHHAELKADDPCSSRNESNFKQIRQAIREANTALNKVRPGWSLTHEHHYQICNRFAWSWKLASLGVPVALVYLGFLRACEMPAPLADEQSWNMAVRRYSQNVVPDNVWGNTIFVDGVPIYPLIRTREIPLP